MFKTPMALAATVLATVALTGCGGSSDGTAPAGDADAFTRLDAAAATRVGLRNAPGMVVGVLLPDGTMRISARGDAAPGTPMTRGTRFEVGSITKTFTATLLAMESTRTPLDTTVADVLPGWRIPGRDGVPVRLQDLATHSAGLPSDLISPAATAANPWAGYTPADLRRDVAAVTLASRPGTAYAYSNVGFALLGAALAHTSGTTYSRLLRDRILEPAGLRSTTTDAGPRPLATGHDAAGRPMPPLDMGPYAPAGALRSDAADMLRWARANLAADEATPLGRAMLLARTSRLPAGPAMRVALGWHILQAPGGQIVWHNGGSPGFRTFLGFSPQRRTAVVVLANDGAAEVDDIGVNALDPALPVATVTARPRTVPLGAAGLAPYTGTYRLDGATLTLTRSGRALRATLPGTPSATLMPTGPGVFLIAETGGLVRFHRGEDDRVTGFTRVEDGATTEGTRTG